ncbi:HNH endonuclease signature motif containing protein [Aeromicrobium sp. Leaf291]|uniref:HNH endonuclease signature motif containing protein n=1 Tax=Aeromicrobium sp. Leaf291 TaxID=1736325 RepID=UPI0009E9E153|nr:HNH endonuclease signature motif containing protein [Aeromicrobium sp. Leaf291]
MTEALPARFWSKVNKTETCWIWTGNTSPDGYGRFLGHSEFGTSLPHRISWQAAKGPVPDGLELDHLCQVRKCVNPDHLEAVTHAENIRRAVERRTHCPKGHPRADNWVSDYAGGHRCLACRRAANAAYMRRRRAKEVAA